MLAKKQSSPIKRPLRKKIGWLLVALVPLALVAPLRQMASWRPRQLAVGIETDLGAPPTAHLGELRAISNNRLFFTPSSPDVPVVSPSGSPVPLSEEETPFFRVLEVDGQIRRAKIPGDYALPSGIPGYYNSPSVQFISDSKVVLSVSDYGSENDTLLTQIFDCQTMRPLKKLQDVVGEMDWGNYYVAQDTTKKDSLLCVAKFEALEWNMSSGKLIRRWKLKRPRDDEYLTDTVYSPHRDCFVQVMAGRIRSWDAKTGKLTHTSASLPRFDLEYGEGDEPSHVSFSPNADLAIYDSILPDGNSGPYCVARCDTAQVLWQIQNSPDGFEWSPDGREIYLYSSAQRSFIIHEARTGRVLRRLQAPPNVDSFYISPDGNRICSQFHGNIWWQRSR